MTEQLLSVRCPNCGQRLGIASDKTEFTCVSCKTTHAISDIAKPVTHKIIISTDEFMDIWRHPDKYSKMKVISVFLTLANISESSWPKEIQIAHKKYKKRQNIKAWCSVIIALLLIIAVIWLF